MISPSANLIASQIIAYIEDLPPIRLFHYSNLDSVAAQVIAYSEDMPSVRSKLAWKCAALIRADRYLQRHDVRPTVKQSEPPSEIW